MKILISINPGLMIIIAPKKDIRMAINLFSLIFSFKNKIAHIAPKIGAKKIIYVSCNPSTQARDSQILKSNNYKLEKLTVVDMFPHTPHVETVGVFKKSK